MTFAEPIPRARSKRKSHTKATFLNKTHESSAHFCLVMDGSIHFLRHLRIKRKTTPIGIREMKKTLGPL